MTLDELIKSKGVKKEYLIKQSEIPRNRFFKLLKKPEKFTANELLKISQVIGVKVESVIEIANRSNMRAKTAILKEMNHVNVCIDRCVQLGNQHDLIQYVAKKEELEKELEGRLRVR